jgi:hypothetical protein
MAWAAQRGRTVITADHDFHDHLFARGTAAPSVVRLSQRGPDALVGTPAQAERLGSLLPGLEPYLASGIAVSVDRARLTVVPLPLTRRLQRLPTGAELESDARRRTARDQPGPTRPRVRAADGHVLERVRERRLSPPDLGRGR